MSVNVETLLQYLYGEKGRQLLPSPGNIPTTVFGDFLLRVLREEGLKPVDFLNGLHLARKEAEALLGGTAVAGAELSQAMVLLFPGIDNVNRFLDACIAARAGARNGAIIEKPLSVVQKQALALYYGIGTPLGISELCREMTKETGKSYAALCESIGDKDGSWLSHLLNDTQNPGQDRLRTFVKIISGGADVPDDSPVLNLLLATAIYSKGKEHYDKDPEAVMRAALADKKQTLTQLMEELVRMHCIDDGGNIVTWKQAKESGSRTAKPLTWQHDLEPRGLYTSATRRWRAGGVPKEEGLEKFADLLDLKAVDQNDLLTRNEALRIMNSMATRLSAGKNFGVTASKVLDTAIKKDKDFKWVLDQFQHRVFCMAGGKARTWQEAFDLGLYAEKFSNIMFAPAIGLCHYGMLNAWHDSANSSRRPQPNAVIKMADHLGLPDEDRRKLYQIVGYDSEKVLAKDKATSSMRILTRARMALGFERDEMDERLGFNKGTVCRWANSGIPREHGDKLPLVVEKLATVIEDRAKEWKGKNRKEMSEARECLEELRDILAKGKPGKRGEAVEGIGSKKAKIASGL